MAQADNGYIYLSCGNRKVAVKALTGQFPDYKAVIPKLGDTPSATLDSQALLKEINAAWKFLDERALCLRLRFKEGSLALDSSYCVDPQFSTEIALAQSDSKDLTIIFNATYIKEFCEHVSGEIEMFFDGPNNTGVFRPKGDDSFLYVVMPMRQ